MTTVRSLLTAPTLRRLAAIIAGAVVAGSAVASARPAAQSPTPPAGPRSVAYLPMLQRAWFAAEEPGYDVESYDIRLNVDVVTTGGTNPRELMDISGGTTIRGRTTVDGLSEIDVAFIRLNNEPLEIRLDGAPARWVPSDDKEHIWVALPQAAPRGTPFEIELTHDNSQAFPARYAQPDGKVIVHAAYGAEPGYWYPGSPDADDRARFRLSVAVPEPFIVVVNAEREREDRADGKAISVWTVDSILPRDLRVHFGRFSVVERVSAAGIPLTLYSPRPPEQSGPVLDAVVRQIDWFAARLGAPYPQLRIIDAGTEDPQKFYSSPQQVSSAAPGMFVLGSADARDGMRFVDRSAVNRLAALWFPVVYDGTYWFHGGLNDYLGLLYGARDQGPEFVRARLMAFERNYIQSVMTDAPLATMQGVYEDHNLGNVAINKPSFAVHAVRLALGDAPFWTALRRYRAGLRPGEWSLAAFEAAAIEAAGPDGAAMRARIEANFHQAAVPRLHLAWSRADGKVRIRICQWTAQPVSFALPVALHGSAGVVASTLAVQAADQVAELPYAGTLDAITPDPEQAILADVVVRPMWDAALPACADLPPPAKGPSGGRAPAGGEDIAWTDAPGPDEAHSRPADAAAGGSIDAAGEPSIGDPFEPTLGNTGYDVITYTVRARIDPVDKQVDAETTVEARAVVTDLTRLSLDFLRVVGGAGLTLSAVEVDGVAATYEQPADMEKLWVDLPRPMAAGEPFTMRFAYAGTPRVVRGGLRPGARQTMRSSGVPTGTGNWIPVNDHPQDKAVWRFELTVSPPFRAVASGVLVEERAGDAASTFVYEMHQPMAPSGVAASVGPFTTVERAGPGGLPIRFHALDDPAAMLRAASRTPDLVAALSRRIAPYPFESYDLFAATGASGGLPYQATMAVDDQRLLTENPRTFESRIANATAYQWFGASVSPHLWSDIWLTAGLPTYLQFVAVDDGVGIEPIAWRMEDIRELVLRYGERLPVSPPVHIYDWNPFYKGALVVHMLRVQLGETAFWQGMRDFYAAHRHATASTDDFEAAMTAAAAGTGVDVAALFDSFVRRSGEPLVHAGWRPAGDGIVRVQLCQAGEPFDMAIVAAAHGGGRSARAGTRLAGAEGTLDIAAPFAVEGVTVDPDLTLPAEIRVVRLADGTATTCDAIAAAWAAGGSAP